MQSRFSNYAPSFLDEHEHIQFSTDFQTELRNRLSEDPFYIALLPELTISTDKLVQLSKRVFKSEFTGSIKHSDSLRGKLYRSIIRMLKDDVTFAELEPEDAETAHIVLDVFEKHPVETEKGYTEESVNLKKLLAALDEIADKVSLCSAAKRIGNLRNEQAKFDEWRQKQLEEKNGMLRGDLQPVIDEISFKTNSALSYLEAQAMINGGDYETSAKLVEEMIMKIMTPARARKTRNGNEEE